MKIPLLTGALALALSPAAALAGPPKHRPQLQRPVNVTNKAFSRATASAVANSRSWSRSSARGGNASASINVPSYQRIRQSGSLRTVPDVLTAGLVASQVGTCAGSASLGAAWLGGGFSFGTTVPDQGCEIRLTSEALIRAGAGRAGVVVLCRDPNAYTALAASGYDCPILPPGYRVVQPDYGPYGPAPVLRARY